MIGIGSPEAGLNSVETEVKQSEKPVLEIYLLRHGESGKDKSDPKRGLTAKGEGEVKAAAERIIDQLIEELLPDFQGERMEAVKSLNDMVSFRLYDSGTTRTLQQIDVEREVLISAGILPENIIMPDAYYQYHDEDRPEGRVPHGGVQGRLEGVRGMDENPDFRKVLDDPEYRALHKAGDTIMAWALTPEEEIPGGVENLSQMKARVQGNIETISKIANRMATRQENPKTTIAIANSHASNTTVTASKLLGVDMQKLGEVETAEGLRLEFYPGSEPKISPFGQVIEEKMTSDEENSTES